jgi:hypothetical protein
MRERRKKKNTKKWKMKWGGEGEGEDTVSNKFVGRCFVLIKIVFHEKDRFDSPIQIEK